MKKAVLSGGLLIFGYSNKKAASLDARGLSLCLFKFQHQHGFTGALLV